MRDQPAKTGTQQPPKAPKPPGPMPQEQDATGGCQLLFAACLVLVLIAGILIGKSFPAEKKKG